MNLYCGHSIVLGGIIDAAAGIPAQLGIDWAVFSISDDDFRIVPTLPTSLTDIDKPTAKRAISLYL